MDRQTSKPEAFHLAESGGMRDGISATSDGARYSKVRPHEQYEHLMQSVHTAAPAEKKSVKSQHKLVL